MTDRKIQTKGGTVVEGDATVGRDFIGRDKTVYIISGHIIVAVIAIIVVGVVAIIRPTDVPRSSSTPIVTTILAESPGEIPTEAFIAEATGTNSTEPTLTLATPALTLIPASSPELTYTLRIDSGVEFIFVHVPAGEFIMGSTPQQIKDIIKLCEDSGYTKCSRFENEQPDHPVTLDAYWLMKTEVTNKQYAACVPCEKPTNTRWNDEYYSDHPVTNINWEQAKAYAQWVGVRLPTEAEWELAARGTDGRLYPWGNQTPANNDNLLNFNRKFNSTQPVGSYPGSASPYGALDMAGNVTEWVADFYVSTYDLMLPIHNPLGPSSGAERAVRGGSYVSPPTHVRATVRDGGSPDAQGSTLGFRLATSSFPGN